MLTFLQNNLANIIIGVVLLILLALAVRYIVGKARRGECAGCSGCSGSRDQSASGQGCCAGCHACTHSEANRKTS